MKRAVVIQHLAFEDLGSLQPALHTAGYSIQYLQAGVDRLDDFNPLEAELLVVLGGPIGVYETAEYPFLADELTLLSRRLAARRPTLGICLGAQLIAAALGARVFAGTNGKEIGWSPLQPASELAPKSVLAPLFAPGVEVLHWHGDTYELPHGATHLAASAQYPQQAFSVDDFALALQFHPEVQPANLERWFIGHAFELAKASVSVPQLRERSRSLCATLEQAAHSVWTQWLAAKG
ncbi:glutamine amidotransferase [Steroidobacter sp.]|uniref:glutamine amidotransferase n=1 Tax=Steroidobacter sp. TaxID=1978227 RepID=UPI001A4EBEA2|nr:glutamine amidotransferase [Steroidobacter sp.]MBL8267272.1 glutamine amidotransferase [Steroidobacter sp.]